MTTHPFLNKETGHPEAITDVVVKRVQAMAFVEVTTVRGTKASCYLGEAQVLDLVTSLLAAGALEYVEAFKRANEVRI